MYALRGRLTARKRSQWYSTPAAVRHRRGVQIMLSNEARARLEELAAQHTKGTKSAVVEDLLLDRRRSR